jgi:hypothetical protein
VWVALGIRYVEIVLYLMQICGSVTEMASVDFTARSTLLWKLDRPLGKSVWYVFSKCGSTVRKDPEFDPVGVDLEPTLMPLGASI